MPEISQRLNMEGDRRLCMSQLIWEVFCLIGYMRASYWKLKGAGIELLIRTEKRTFEAIDHVEIAYCL